MDIFAEKTILTVTRLSALIRGVLEENFEHVWVEGEVSNLSLPSSGHIYFTLKDAGAQIRCVMFKGAARNLKFRLNEGMGLIVRGRVSVYDQRGEYQIICEYLEPAGVGALQMAFAQLKERLAAEGLFDEKRKRPLPRLPRTVGVITSATGAAIHDILTVLRRRFASLHIILYPVRVQGDGSAAEIATAIAEMNRLAEADVLIVGRGGGSLEDLWAFNEEVVARAIHRSRIPVISAVGHETDWSISDFVADLRAATPSAAAELVSASADEMRGQVEALTHRLHLAMRSCLTTRSSQVVALRRALHDPTTLLGHLAQRVDDLGGRLERAAVSNLERRREAVLRLDQALAHHAPTKLIGTKRQHIQQLHLLLEHAIHQIVDKHRTAIGAQTARLEVLSPLGTLARGYAIATNALGRVVTDAGSLNIGDRVAVRLKRGTALCRVESHEPPTP